MGDRGVSIVVPGTASHALEILDVKIAAVEGLCAEDCRTEQMDRWTGLAGVQEIERKIARDPTFVAVANDQVIGYSQVALLSGEILAVYDQEAGAR